MAPRSPIYLDHHATTPLDPSALEAMLPFLRDEFGNAASGSHVYGWRAAAAVEDAREKVAAAIGAEPSEVVFTSGATESNNLAILGAARERRERGRDGVVTLASEHPAVLDPARALLREGFRVSEVAVDGDGLADLDALANAIDERTAIVSVMAANNEIGVLQPLPEIAALCRAAGAWFHSDAAQAVGKVPFDVNEARVDLASISAHKLYGPKGVGALYVRARRPRVRLEPILYGGGHEGGLRSGTLAVAPIVGLGVALDVCLANREPEAKRLRELRERLWARLSELGGVRLNGHAEHRLPGNLNVSFEGVDIDKLLLALPDVAVSTGSACSSAKPEPSHVLRALGLSEAEARASLRFGLGRSTTAAEIDAASSRVAEEVRKQRGD